jgi:Zn-dependent peptidase ImmA (M78 family)
MRLPNPEKAALELLERAGQRHPPVDLGCVAAWWPGLKISTDTLDQEGYLVDLGAQGAEIIVRANDPLPRRRYTIAHELGHWVLQHSDSLSGEHNAIIPHAVIERWCDRFASALLMPRAWVVGDLRRAKLSGLLGAVLSAPSTYQVSHQAFRLRIAELTPASFFQLRQKEGTVSIELRYETRRVPSESLSKTLLGVISLLAEAHRPVRYLHPETQFLSLYQLLSRDAQGHNWFICILPKTQLRLSDPSPQSGQ